MFNKNHDFLNGLLRVGMPLARALMLSGAAHGRTDWGYTRDDYLAYVRSSRPLSDGRFLGYLHHLTERIALCLHEAAIAEMHQRHGMLHAVAGALFYAVAQVMSDYAVDRHEPEVLEDPAWNAPTVGLRDSLWAGIYLAVMSCSAYSPASMLDAAIWEYGSHTEAAMLASLRDSARAAGE